MSRSKNETDFDESEDKDDDSVIQESISSSRKGDRESKFSEKEKSKDPTFDFSKGKEIKENLISGVVRIRLIHAKALVNREYIAEDANYKSAVNVVFEVPGGALIRSNSVKDTSNPIWDQELNIFVTVDKSRPGQISAWVFENKYDVGDTINSIGV